MKIVFLSNYFNHHQRPLSNQLYALTDGDYYFIATTKISSERLKLGYEVESADYVIEYDKNEDKCNNLIDQADALIVGHVDKKFIQKRLKDKKLTIYYSERIFKQKGFTLKNVARVLKYSQKFKNRKNVYMLCASAYLKEDLGWLVNPIKNTFKWGYFPYAEESLDLQSLINSKKPKSILWVGRFIDWKRPFLAINLAKKLKENGKEFSLTFIGAGVLENKIKSSIVANGLQDNVQVLGAKPPEEVRKYMKESKICLFTSDCGEGWGAIANEAMSCGNAMVINRQIGCAPYLIKDGENGLIFDNEEQLYNHVERLLNDNSLCSTLGKNAYQTIHTTWNGQVAGQRLYKFITEILNGNDVNNLFSEGPLSKEQNENS